MQEVIEAADHTAIAIKNQRVSIVLEHSMVETMYLIKSTMERYMMV